MRYEVHPDVLDILLEVTSTEVPDVFLDPGAQVVAMEILVRKLRKALDEKDAEQMGHAIQVIASSSLIIVDQMYREALKMKEEEDPDDVA